MQGEHGHIEPQRVCVLLAPESVDIGKNVTDAVRHGGWSLVRVTEAIDAMANLCRLEQARRSTAMKEPSRHMLLIHRDVHVDVNGALQAAVRKHLPGLRVHEIQSSEPVRGAVGSAPTQAAKGIAATAGRAAHVAGEESAVVGRIGVGSMGSHPAAPVHRSPVVLADEDDARVVPAQTSDKASDAAAQEVTRDEISMLLGGSRVEDR